MYVSTPEMKALERQVFKANDLIQKSRFSLSLTQQKIVLYLISKITPFDEQFKLYEFSIPEFCRICGISETGNYADLKIAIKEIADKSLWITLEDDEETLLRWIEKPYVNKQSGTIKIRLDNDMKPFLLQLKENFTSYELIWTLHFKSKYTIRLYELMKSIHFRELEEYSKDYELKELRKLLDAEKYTRWIHFKQRVLEPSIEEINRYSDKNISWEPIRKGKAIEKIRFTISSKDTFEALKLKDEIIKEMGYEQLSLFDELENRGMIP